MRYTVVRVNDEGVVLFALHAQRLAPEGPAVSAAFAAFARDATPGTYALFADADALRIEPRAGSRLVEGMPTRLLPSPFADGERAHPKPSSGYESVRLAGTSTLLTSADGAEIFESCMAAVVGWNGERWVLVPVDRPRVQSVAEAAISAHLPHLRAPLRTDEAMPLLLVNAVKGPCRVAVPDREAFPQAPIDALHALFRALTRRP